MEFDAISSCLELVFNADERTTLFIVAAREIMIRLCWIAGTVAIFGYASHGSLWGSALS